MQKKRSYNASFFSMEKGWQRPRQVATLLYGKMFLSGLAPNAKHKTGLYHTKIIFCFRFLAYVFRHYHHHLL